jgi:hypothetical protein
MKRNFIRSGVLALLIGFSSVALGNPEVKNDKDSTTAKSSSSLQVNIYPRKNGFVAVNFRKQLEETVEIKIFTRKGAQVYVEKVTEDQLIGRRYNLSNLPDGYYYFEVSNGNYLVRQLVNKQN